MTAKHLFWTAVGLMLCIAACQKPEGGDEIPQGRPNVVKVTPEDGTTGIQGTSLKVVLTYDVNIKCPSSVHGNITAGDATVEKVNAYLTDLTITLSGLERGKTYVLSIPEGTVSDFKGRTAGALELTYATADQGEDPIHSKLDPVKELSNPDATPQARKVYDFLLEQSGRKTLSGVQSSSSNSNDFVDFIYKKTGKHPALAGYDFIFLQYSPTPEGWSWVQNYNDISAAKEQWQNNGLVSYMWHWNVPDSEAAWTAGVEKGDFNGYNFYTDKTSFDIKEALKDGTWQNRFILKDLEEAAGYLKLLQDAGIPVIWRPFHEAAGNYDLYGPNGAWFWWGKGGAEPCKALWRLMHDKFTKEYGLNNLIWVWTLDATPGCEDQFADWYPGNDYVDIVGVDIYESNTDAKTRQYQAAVDLTEGKKLVTISECGNIPDPKSCFGAGNAWSWFMVWCTTDANGNLALSSDNWPLNTESWWKSVLGSEEVITREEMPSDLHN